MKKNNVIIFVVLFLISIFLLWFWYYLEFNKIDTPLDLVISLLWWVLIIVAIVVISRLEKVRRNRVRTIYVTDNEVYNSEAGIIPYDDPIRLISVLEEILVDLEYDFVRKDPPDKKTFPVKYLVRTDDFEYDSEDKNETWEGELVLAHTRERIAFESKLELFNLLNRY